MRKASQLNRVKQGEYIMSNKYEVVLMVNEDLKLVMNSLIVEADSFMRAEVVALEEAKEKGMAVEYLVCSEPA